MASRTVVDSVDVVEGPPREVAALEAQLDELRRRFPGAILERYLDRVPRAAERVRIAPGAAVIHGCRIGGGTLVGIQATILDDAVIGEGCVIGSCALVTAGSVIPPHSLVMGIPGKVVRTLSAEDETFHRRLAGKYTRLAHNYRVG